jgi:hypothetical protein
MSCVVKQNVLVRFDDSNPIVFEMFLEPIGFHQRLGMRVLRWVRCHRTANFRPLSQVGNLYLETGDAVAATVALGIGKMDDVPAPGEGIGTASSCFFMAAANSRTFFLSCP